MEKNFANVRKRHADSIKENATANYNALRKARRALHILRSRDAINYELLSPYEVVEIEIAFRRAGEQVHKIKKTYGLE